MNRRLSQPNQHIQLQPPKFGDTQLTPDNVSNSLQTGQNRELRRWKSLPDIACIGKSALSETLNTLGLQDFEPLNRDAKSVSKLQDALNTLKRIDHDQFSKEKPTKVQPFDQTSLFFALNSNKEKFDAVMTLFAEKLLPIGELVIQVSTENNEEKYVPAIKFMLDQADHTSLHNAEPGDYSLMEKIEKMLELHLNLGEKIDKLPTSQFVLNKIIEIEDAKNIRDPQDNTFDEVLKYAEKVAPTEKEMLQILNGLERMAYRSHPEHQDKLQRLLSFAGPNPAYDQFCQGIELEVYGRVITRYY